MSTKVKLSQLMLWAGVVFLALIVGEQFLTTPANPKFEGIPLSNWLEDLDNVDSEKIGRATKAIKSIGKDSIPYLLKMIGTRTGLLTKYCEHYGLIGIRNGAKPDDAQQMRSKAIQGFAVLGEKGASADDALGKLLTSKVASRDAEFAGEIAAALAKIGSSGKRVLLFGLTNSTLHIRKACAYYLADSEQFDGDVFRAFMSERRSADSEIRYYSILYLDQDFLDCSLRASLLEEFLSDKDPFNRTQAMKRIFLLNCN